MESTGAGEEGCLPPLPLEKKDTRHRRRRILGASVGEESGLPPLGKNLAPPPPELGDTPTWEVERDLAKEEKIKRASDMFRSAYVFGTSTRCTLTYLIHDSNIRALGLNYQRESRARNKR
jgi:hypothetical protein